MRISTLAVLLAACDALVQTPRIPQTKVTIVHPPTETVLTQPGPSLEFELEVERCERLAALHIKAGKTEIAQLTGPGLQAATIRIVVPVNELLGKVPWDVVDGRPLVDLSVTAHATCDDFAQQAISEAVRLSLRPTTIMVAVTDGVSALLSDEPGSMLLVGTTELQQLRYAMGNQVATVQMVTSAPIDERGPGAAWQLGERIFLWKGCPSCPSNVAGQLYLVQPYPLRLQDSLELPCDPLGVVPRPHDEQIVIALRDCAGGSELALVNPDLSAYRELNSAGGGMLTSLRHNAASAQLVGLAHGGPEADYSARHFQVAPLGASFRPLGLGIAPGDTLAVIEDAGQWIAWVDTGALALYRLVIGSDASPRRSDLGELDTPVRLTALNSVLLLVSDGKRLRAIDPNSGAQKWQRHFESPIQRLAQLAENRIAVLTADANLLVLGEAGELRDEQGPLSALGQPGPTLLATPDGFVHYTVSDGQRTWLLGYRTESH